VGQADLEPTILSHYPEHWDFWGAIMPCSLELSLSIKPKRSLHLPFQRQENNGFLPSLSSGQGFLLFSQVDGVKNKHFIQICQTF
jgi:hypothetical protein